MAKAHKVIGVAPLRSYHENARIILPQRLEEVYTWEPFIRDETRREELHNMRISIKRLRYTMELFRVAYQVAIRRNSRQSSVVSNQRSSGQQSAISNQLPSTTGTVLARTQTVDDGLLTDESSHCEAKPKANTLTADCYSADCQYTEFLEAIVDLQETLGDIHDADVVLRVLVDCTSQSGNQGRQIDVPLGVATLITRTQETRKADYGTFLEKWDQLSAAGFKQKLLSFFGVSACKPKTCY